MASFEALGKGREVRNQSPLERCSCAMRLQRKQSSAYHHTGGARNRSGWRVTGPARLSAAGERLILFLYPLFASPHDFYDKFLISRIWV